MSILHAATKMFATSNLCAECTSGWKECSAAWIALVKVKMGADFGGLKGLVLKIWQWVTSLIKSNASSCLGPSTSMASDSSPCRIKRFHLQPVSRSLNPTSLYIPINQLPLTSRRFESKGVQSVNPWAVLFGGFHRSYFIVYCGQQDRRRSGL